MTSLNQLYEKNPPRSWNWKNSLRPQKAKVLLPSEAESACAFDLPRDEASQTSIRECAWRWVASNLISPLTHRFYRSATQKWRANSKSAAAQRLCWSKVSHMLRSLASQTGLVCQDRRGSAVSWSWQRSAGSTNGSKATVLHLLCWSTAYTQLQPRTNQ